MRWLDATASTSGTVRADHVTCGDPGVDRSVAHLAKLSARGEPRHGVVEHATADAAGRAQEQQHGAGQGERNGQQHHADTQDDGTAQGADEPAPDPPRTDQVPGPAKAPGVESSVVTSLLRCRCSPLVTPSLREAVRVSSSPVLPQVGG